MSTPTKALRIGIFHGKRCIEERLIRERVDRVSIGQKLGNTFVVPSSSMPAHHLLFVTNRGQIQLRLSSEMGGRISLDGDQILDLARLEQRPNTRRQEWGWEIDLDLKARGKITMGEFSLLFQFIAAPPPVQRMLPSALGGGMLAGFSTFLGGTIITAILLSGLLQIGPLFYVIMQDWPEPEGYQEIPDWYLEREAEARLEEEKELAEKQEDLEDEEGPGDGQVEETPIADSSLDEPKPTESKPKSIVNARPKTPAEAAEQRRLKKTQGRKIVGQVFGVEGGDSIGAAIASDVVGSNSYMTALDNISASDIRGPGSQGEGAGMGFGLKLGQEAGPEGDGPRLLDSQVESSHSLTQTQETKAPQERKRVDDFKVKTETKLPKGFDPGSKKDVESYLRGKKRQITGCYKRIIQKYGSQPGKLVLQFTVGTDGKVLKVKVLSDSVGNGMASCVEAKVKRWKFPALAKPTTIAKRWIFD